MRAAPLGSGTQGWGAGPPLPARCRRLEWLEAPLREQPRSTTGCRPLGHEAITTVPRFHCLSRRKWGQPFLQGGQVRAGGPSLGVRGEGEREPQPGGPGRHAGGRWAPGRGCWEPSAGGQSLAPGRPAEDGPGASCGLSEAEGAGRGARPQGLQRLLPALVSARPGGQPHPRCRVGPACEGGSRRVGAGQALQWDHPGRGAAGLAWPRVGCRPHTPRGLVGRSWAHITVSTGKTAPF